jgi:hypothetical protein
MYPKQLTTSQRKKNKKNKKTIEKRNKKILLKKEIKILSKIANYIPEDVIKLLYSFISGNIKYNLSHYKQLFTQFIFDYNTINKCSLIFRGYTDYNYCTHYDTAFSLKEMLHQIPLDKLQKYLYFGTPGKYFNIAFPYEPNIKYYIVLTYNVNDITSKDDKIIKCIYKNYIFEILDLISYFSTKANEWHALHCNNKYFSQLNLMNSAYNYEEYNKQTEAFCKENEIKYSTLGYWIKQVKDKNNQFTPVKVRTPDRCDPVFYKIETPIGIRIYIPSGAKADDLNMIFKTLGVVA